MMMMWVRLTFLRGNWVITCDMKSLCLSFPGHQLPSLPVEIDYRGKSRRPRRKSGRGEAELRIIQACLALRSPLLKFRVFERGSGKLLFCAADDLPKS
jgi:hypothetical protein